MKKVLMVGIKVSSCYALLISPFLRKNLFLIVGLSFYLMGISVVPVQANKLKEENDRDAKITVAFNLGFVKVGFVKKFTGTINQATYPNAPSGTPGFNEVDEDSEIGRKTVIATVNPPEEAANIEIAEQPDAASELIMSYE